MWSFGRSLYRALVELYAELPIRSLSRVLYRALRELYREPLIGLRIELL